MSRVEVWSRLLEREFERAGWFRVREDERRSIWGLGDARQYVPLMEGSDWRLLFWNAVDRLAWSTGEDKSVLAARCCATEFWPRAQPVTAMQITEDNVEEVCDRFSGPNVPLVPTSKLTLHDSSEWWYSDRGATMSHSAAPAALAAWFSSHGSLLLWESDWLAEDDGVLRLFRDSEFRGTYEGNV